MKTQQTRKLNMGERYADIVAEDRAKVQSEVEYFEQHKPAPAQAQHSPLTTNLGVCIAHLKIALAGRDEAQAHARRLADAIRDYLASNRLPQDYRAISEALAQWEDKESPADADALEALDQLEQAQ